MSIGTASTSSPAGSGTAVVCSSPGVAAISQGLLVRRKKGGRPRRPRRASAPPGAGGPLRAGKNPLPPRPNEPADRGLPPRRRAPKQDPPPIKEEKREETATETPPAKRRIERAPF